MGAPLEICSKRGVVAVLASGMVISLTALTGGIAPAFAQPDDAVTTTVVAPEPEAPEVETPEVEEEQSVAEEPSTVAPQAPQTQLAPQTEVTQTQVPQRQAPQIQSPQTEDEAEPVEPQTQAPAPPRTSTTVQTAEPTTEPSPTVERSPVQSPAPSPATTTAPRNARSAPPATTDADEPTYPTTGPSAALVPAPDAGDTPTSRDSSETPTSGDATAEATTEESGESETPTVSISQAAKELETLAPERLEAPVQDVQLARSSKPIVLEEQPAPAADSEIASFSSSIENSLKIPGLDIGASANTEFGLGGSDVELVSNVRQWRPDWIEYDEFFRPVILNPFQAPVRLVYLFERQPRFVFIPPLARIVLEVAQFAAYSFTAAVLNPINLAVDAVQTLTNIAVGSFFGGGFFPGVGLPLPAPPPPVLRFDNVPVFVNYSQAQYEPFRVRQIVDVGEDRVFGGRKVLLDGVTPVWGEWTQTATGERQFEVRRTQQFPGLSEPAEGPLPGDYRLRLAADESSTAGLTGRDIFLMVAAGVIGTLGFGAIGLAFFLGRRRAEH